MVSRRLRFEGRGAWIGVLNEDGLGTLRRNGHEAVAGACAPDLPAANVRFVDPTVRQSLESASDTELRRLYTSPYPRQPLIIGKRGGEGGVVTIELAVQPDLHCLRGHFPAIPIVPGATQLGWALEFGAQNLGTPPTMCAMRSVKFERIIQPGHSLRLQLTADSGASILRFEYVSQLGRHSVGCIETRAIDG